MEEKGGEDKARAWRLIADQLSANSPAVLIVGLSAGTALVDYSLSRLPGVA